MVDKIVHSNTSDIFLEGSPKISKPETMDFYVFSLADIKKIILNTITVASKNPCTILFGIFEGMCKKYGKKKLKTGVTILKNT